jgi:tetratricopeptide (TPR) repeat protein
MNRLKKITIHIGLILVASFSLQMSAQISPDERLFQEAKILIFDKKWEQAQEKLEELLEDYPASLWYSQALFYWGRTLEEQKGKEKEALEAFKKYILRKDSSEILIQEAETSVINLSFTLYEKGRKSYLKEIKTRLYRPNRVIKYYAAIKLSYLENKKEARDAIPVLKEILDKEKDEEIRDKAKIALLRINPDTFKDFEEERYERKIMMLKIRVTNKWTKEITFHLNIPWALADLALVNIPDEAKRQLRQEGYDLDRIIKELIEGQRVIEIETKDSILKIWID